MIQINMKSNNIVVIAAGGYGTRLGSTLPKSLLMAGGCPILYYTIREALKLNVERVYVHTNRRDLVNEYNPLLLDLSKVELLINEDFESTFGIINKYYRTSKKNILFLYGHCPVKAEFLRAMLRVNQKVCCTTKRVSTKSKTVRTNSGWFVEPPIYIPSKYIDRPFRSWGEFLFYHQQTIEYLNDNSPNEFNYLQEFYNSKEYIEHEFTESKDEVGVLSDLLN